MKNKEELKNVNQEDAESKKEQNDFNLTPSEKDVKEIKDKVFNRFILPVLDKL